MFINIPTDPLRCILSGSCLGRAREYSNIPLTFDKKRGYCQQVPTGDAQMLTEKVALGSFEKQLRELPKGSNIIG
ncbi:hypothetical protein TWF225_009396 [Orbilia oligospora]|uniref:Uncharacterized protein n=1 Tax=Orbilia oligospora TaxID=2813651 RepID=A0A7C8PSM0_ORBOL|nr:hypothetical protein TWF751_001969 [Orbilia oligospora]KAF3193855.1 hypothetical protein TWF225_009396 [Orbilia oligospora]KAF3270041.1 hypothetical protein TWF217_008383 [Orbilia oligospora]KAF3270511.1 hypothetical protein TWF128_004272 [Orbilia oligospora]KAF3298006.1 hypothetical protein TWF132_004151 [Orbilia oligospora]